MEPGAPGEARSGPPPRVSVVLPVCNGAATVAATLESVLRQTWQDFELLVIDDGSTDATPAIVAGIRDPRLKMHRYENRGLSASRNRGIALARGEFVAFIDADDLWAPAKLERQVRALEADPAAGLAYCWTDCIDGEGRFLKPGSHVRLAGHVYAELVARNFLDNGSSALVRLGVLAEAGPFDETLRGAEDWDMWLRIAHRHALACVPEVLVLYRIHGQSMSASIDRQIANTRLVLGRGLARLPDEALRRRAERAALTGIYRYTALKLIETGTGREAGRAAFHWWAQFVRITPTPLRHAGKALLMLAAIGVMGVLPDRLVALARDAVTRLSGLFWTSPLAGRRG